MGESTRTITLYIKGQVDGGRECAIDAIDGTVVTPEIESLVPILRALASSVARILHTDMQDEPSYVETPEFTADAATNSTRLASLLGAHKALVDEAVGLQRSRLGYTVLCPARLAEPTERPQGTLGLAEILVQRREITAGYDAAGELGDREDWDEAERITARLDGERLDLWEKVLIGIAKGTLDPVAAASAALGWEQL